MSAQDVDGAEIASSASSDGNASPALGSRVALVHDWCPSFRGGERVLAEFCAMFKGSEVYTLFDFLAKDVKDEHFPGIPFHTSGANRLPLVEKYYRSLFPVCPFLIEQFDVTSYDAVISSSAAFARGVITRPDQPHLCYVHSPVRYAWDEQFSYLAQGRLAYGPKGLLYRYFLHTLRIWDTRTAHGPDLMLANSSFVQARIKRIYGRDFASGAPAGCNTRAQIRAAQGRLLHNSLVPCSLQADRPGDRGLQLHADPPPRGRWRRSAVEGAESDGRAQRGVHWLPAAPRVRAEARSCAGPGVRGVRGFWHSTGGSPGLWNALDRVRARWRSRHRLPTRSGAPANRYLVRSANCASCAGRCNTFRGPSRPDQASLVSRECRAVFRGAVSA